MPKRISNWALSAVEFSVLRTIMRGIFSSAGPLDQNCWLTAALVCLCSSQVPTSLKYTSISSCWGIPFPFVFSQFCLNFHSLPRILHASFQRVRWPPQKKSYRNISKNTWTRFLRFAEINMTWSLAQSEILKGNNRRSVRRRAYCRKRPHARATRFRHKISRFLFRAKYIAIVCGRRASAQLRRIRDRWILRQAIFKEGRTSCTQAPFATELLFFSYSGRFWWSIWNARKMLQLKWGFFRSYVRQFSELHGSSTYTMFSLPFFAMNRSTPQINSSNFYRSLSLVEYVHFFALEVMNGE